MELLLITIKAQTQKLNKIRPKDNISNPKIKNKEKDIKLNLYIKNKTNPKKKKF